MNDGNLTLQAIVSERANAILQDGNNSMSLFQLYKSVTSVLNQETREKSFNVTLQTSTRKEVSQTLVFLQYSGLFTFLDSSPVIKPPEINRYFKFLASVSVFDMTFQYFSLFAHINNLSYHLSVKELIHNCYCTPTNLDEVFQLKINVILHYLNTNEMASPVGATPHLIFPTSSRWQVILVCSVQLPAYVSVISLCFHSAWSASDVTV